VIFKETKLRGAFVVDIDRRQDDRGFFARAFCQHEFRAHGLTPAVAQVNLSSSRAKGTIRGMHFQYSSAAEAKFIRCIRGAILDVIVDLRPESDTYLEHFFVELSAENYRALYIPERFAHGLQTLCDNTDVIYHASEFYTPSAEAGLCYDDPRLGLSWPLPVTAISEKDRTFPALAAIEPELKRRMTLCESVLTHS
jgi:dTDP-4-dehydrorhamnose 3,5-epimerase